MIDAKDFSREMGGLFGNKPMLKAEDFDKLLFSRKDNEPISFDDCSIYKVELVGVDLSGCSFKNTVFYECSYEKCNFEKANFEKSDIYGISRVNECNFKGVNFEQASISNFYTYLSDFSDAKFTFAKLRNCLFRDGTKFLNNNFYGLEINSVFFRNVDVKDAQNLDSIYVTMSGATNEEINRHRETVKEALSGNCKPTEKSFVQHVNTNLEFCKRKLQVQRVLEISNLTEMQQEEYEMER